MAPGVVVGDDDLLIFASGRLGHTVGACRVEDVEFLIQLHNEGAVIVGHHDIRLARSFNSNRLIDEQVRQECSSSKSW